MDNHHCTVIDTIAIFIDRIDATLIPLMAPGPIDGIPVNGGIDGHLWFINGRIDDPLAANTSAGDFRWARGGKRSVQPSLRPQ